MFVHHFVNPGLRVEIIFRKERTAENGGIDFEIVDIRHHCTLVLVHELIPFLGSPWGKNIIWILSNLGVYFLEKYDGLSESVALAQNWGILQTRMNQREDQMKMNFWPFGNIKINVTKSYTRKSRWKNVVINLVSMLSSWVMVLVLFKNAFLAMLCWPQPEI